MVIASLMMYERPQLTGAHRRLWGLVRTGLTDRGVAAPEELDQDAEEFSVWTSRDLVLSQTCGMPYRLWLHDKVELVGTPDYGLAGCAPGCYRSAIVVRAADPRRDVEEFEASPFAYNQTFSQSGYAAPYAHMKDRGFWFQNRIQSGAHLRSAQAVADGTADIAAIDAVSWRLMVAYESFAPLLRVLDWTAPTPGLPLITAVGRPAGQIFAAVESAIDLLAESDRALLGTTGLVRIPKERYLAVDKGLGGQ